MNEYTTTKEICDCYQGYGLAITVRYDEEGFGDTPVFHNEMSDICAECLSAIQDDESFFNVVVEPHAYLF
jgi:hypothetical protein